MSIARHFPLQITSYDLVKSFAIILMLFDHVGFYFFPDDDWLRIVGRGCAPILFFLTGYARTRVLEKRLWVGAFIMELGRFAAGLPIFPLSILMSFLLIRYGLDKLMAYVMSKPECFWQINFCFVLIVIPTSFLFEYGVQGVSIAMLGWMVRRWQEKDPHITKDIVHTQFLFSILNYIFWECITFGFNKDEMFVLSFFIISIMGGMIFFRDTRFPGFSSPVFMPFRWLLQFGGRWTLEIYIIHILIFQTLATFTDPVRFPAFHFLLFPK